MHYRWAGNIRIIQAIRPKKSGKKTKRETRTCMTSHNKVREKDTKSISPLEHFPKRCRSPWWWTYSVLSTVCGCQVWLNGFQDFEDFFFLAPKRQSREPNNNKSRKTKESPEKTRMMAYKTNRGVLSPREDHNVCRQQQWLEKGPKGVDINERKNKDRFGVAYKSCVTTKPADCIISV